MEESAEEKFSSGWHSSSVLAARLMGEAAPVRLDLNAASRRRRPLCFLLLVVEEGLVVAAGVSQGTLTVALALLSLKGRGRQPRKSRVCVCALQGMWAPGWQPCCRWGCCRC
jgi:hypothetical protein